MKRLIVNADDFGLHPAANSGIVEGFRNGVIRSASIIASGRAASEAAELASENPGLGVGVHLTLVAERPVLDPSKVRSLVEIDGKFFSDHNVFIKKFFTGKIKKDEIAAECFAQIARVKSLGISPTHIDSHQHLHVLPGIFEIVRELAREYGVYKIRIPDEDFSFTGGFQAPLSRHAAKCSLTFCARIARRRISGEFSAPDHFFGMLAGGNMIPENFFRIIGALPEGTSEIMIHPGKSKTELAAEYDWGYHWEEELASVVSEKAQRIIDDGGVKLISFAEL